MTKSNLPHSPAAQPRRLTVAEAEALAERYFEAQTSEEEERALACFAATPEAAAPQFDELRAALSLAAFARQRAHAAPPFPSRTAQPAAQRISTRRWHLGLRYAAAAAVAGVVMAAAWTFPHKSPDCVAYIHGERTTNSAAVEAAMHRSLSDIAAPLATETMEEQMAEALDFPLP